VGKGSDNIYHVVGELIVVHEITLATTVTNLKRIIALCGGGPFPRYINSKCCDAGDHCTHLAVPKSGDKIFDDLRRIQLSAVPNCQVTAAGDLLLNKKKKAMAEIMKAYSTSWGTVHGNQAAYTRMVLGITDIFSSNNSELLQILPTPAALPAAALRHRSGSAFSLSNIPVISGLRFRYNSRSEGSAGLAAGISIDSQLSSPCPSSRLLQASTTKQIMPLCRSPSAKVRKMPNRVNPLVYCLCGE